LRGRFNAHRQSRKNLCEGKAASYQVMSQPRIAVQISIYLSEDDQWNRKPLHMELLKFLREQEIMGATVLHAVAGFTGRGRVKTTTLVDAGGKLPLVLTFVDTADHVERVLPKVKEMAGHRLIVRENVTVETGQFE
jgi:PII-like signaling protein